MSEDYQKVSSRLTHSMTNQADRSSSEKATKPMMQGEHRWSRNRSAIS